MNDSRPIPLLKTWFAVVCCMMGILLLLESCMNVAPAVSVDPSREPFLNSRYLPPADQYTGTLFKLSQDYPTAMPDSSQLPAFFNVDFRNDWREYMMQVRDYCFEGNTGVDWRVEDNSVRRWYHMPWQDYGFKGREGIHGLTREASLSPGQLSAMQDPQYKNSVAYAVGFYNEFGGYTIGQVWKDHAKPDPTVTSNAGFPVGTVVCKLLFVDMPGLSPAEIAAQVPYLSNPIEWQAYTIDPSTSLPAGTPTPTPLPACAPDNSPRSVKKVTLIQMDIMIRDDRADQSGWIFGTFQYNGALANDPPWNNLVPVGLMWGNDPDYAENVQNIPDQKTIHIPAAAVTDTPINTDLKETVINPGAELPPTHLGWEGRLNGPVDKPLSSCMSCHMTASDPVQPLSPLFTSPPTGTQWQDWWMKFFQNVGWKDGKLDKFMNATNSLDFSLQLAAALENFHTANSCQPSEHSVQR